MIVDDDEIELAAGDILRVAPEGKRQIFAAEDADLKYAGSKYYNKVTKKAGITVKK